ncbi:MAG: hypothetical protein ACOC2E_06050 [Bacteroidota bacterium]
MKTFKAFLLTLMSVCLFGMIFLLLFSWLAYGWEEAAGSTLSMVIAGVIMLVLFPLFYKRRLKYLDSKEWTPPVFKDSRYREYEFDVDRFEFEQFKQFVEERFVISGSSNNTLKFRQKFTLWSWGAGAFLNYDRDAGKIKVHYFPISGYTRHATMAVKKMDNSVEELIRRSLNS